MKKLEGLQIGDSTISDLSPLKAMKLTWLGVSGTPVSDLSPLKGMKLTWLACSYTKVSDLSPLNGMPLKELNCGETKVTDASLAQLKDCKDLGHLILFGTQVSDAGLSHLKELKNLKMLQLYGTKVSDLSPLKDMALEFILVTPKTITPPGPGDAPQHEEPQNHRHRPLASLAGGGVLGSLREGGVHQVT